MARQTTERPAEQSRRWLIAVIAGLGVLAIAIWAVEREPAGTGPKLASAPLPAPVPGPGPAPVPVPVPGPAPAPDPARTEAVAAPGAQPRRSGMGTGTGMGTGSGTGVGTGSRSADAGSDAGPPTPAALAGLYISVGRHLAALSARKGETATLDLWPRYRWIRIDDAIAAPPERRQEVARMLQDLERDVAAR